MSEQLKLPMGSGSGYEYTLCVGCGLKSPLGEVYCVPCLALLVKAGRNLTTNLKDNKADAPGVVPEHNRKRHRPA